MPNNASLGRTLLVTAFVAGGIAMAWGMIAVWMWALVHSATQSGELYEQLYSSAEGEPVIVRISRAAHATEQVRTLAGDAKQLSSHDLLYPQYNYGRERSPYVGNGTNWATRLVSANDGGLPPIYWYVVHDGGRPARAYGVGYHSQTRRIVGYFSRQGFGEVPPDRNQWFDVPSEGGLSGTTNLTMFGREPVYVGGDPRFLLLADGKLWQVDLVQRQLKAVLDCPQAFSVGQAWKILAERPTAPPGASPLLAQQITPTVGLLRQPDSLLIVEPTSGKSTTFRLPDSLRRVSLAASLLPDGNLLVFGTDWQKQTEFDVAWLKPDAQGDDAIARQQRVRLASWNTQPSLAAMGWMAALAAPAPIVNAIFTATVPASLVRTEEASSYSAALGRVLSQTWTSILAVLIAGVVSAAAAFRRQRRFGLPHAGAWAAFAFLFGIPGWVAYRFHRAWPVVEECPSCHQAAPRDRERCLDCGAAFPPPPLKGIEVFA